MKRLIFSIFIDIEDHKLDNPATFDEQGKLLTTDKSKIVKQSFTKYNDHLAREQQSYADQIGADYMLMNDPLHYQRFALWFEVTFPWISKYDVINFYKHYCMRSAADDYDQVCYVDLDVIFNTTENIFESLPVNSHFCVPDSNTEADWGKRIEAKHFNTCIRNPATKYWNTRAMLSEWDLDHDVNVYNTGLMVASSPIIRSLEYFSQFEEFIQLMHKVKTDTDSMYPSNIQRVFNYDNETLFAFLTIINNVPVHIIPKEWHCAVRGVDYDPNAKVFHVIDKIFERFFRD